MKSEHNPQEGFNQLKNIPLEISFQDIKSWIEQTPFMPVKKSSWLSLRYIKTWLHSN